MLYPIDGDRVRLLRQASQFSQTDLSVQLGLAGNSTVSKIESGRSPEVEEQLLRGLANALDCSETMLATPPADVLSTRPWLRAYADAKAKDLESITADNHLHHEFVDASNLRRMPVSIPEFTGDVNDPAAIESYSLEMRAEAGIDEGAAVKNVVRATERLGCVVLPLDGELNPRHLGLSQYIDGVPYIRVSRPTTSDHQSIPGDRQRFTVAHELGHLGLHAQASPPQSSEEAARVERQAHRFAGAFLVPADPLIDDLEEFGGRVTLNSLAALKSKWGVAIKALVVRLQQLDVVSADQAVSLYKQISSRGWNAHEPVTVTNETPVWLPKAMARSAGSSAPDLVQWAADQHGLGPTFHRRWTNWTGGTEDGTAALVTLEGRQPSHRPRRSSRSDTEIGGVTQLRRR